MGHPQHSEDEPLWLALQNDVKPMGNGPYTAASPTWEVGASAKIAAGSSLCAQRREEVPLAWKRMDCPEPRVSLGSFRWLINSFTRFGNRETRRPDVRLISKHLHVCRRQEKLWNPLLLTKGCTIPVVRVQRDPTLWETLIVKVTWKTQHQWPFPPRTPHWMCHSCPCSGPWGSTAASTPHGWPFPSHSTSPSMQPDATATRPPATWHASQDVERPLCSPSLSSAVTTHSKMCTTALTWS